MLILKNSSDGIFHPVANMSNLEKLSHQSHENTYKAKITVDEFCRIIERQNRCQAGDSVPAQALFLEDVGYPEDIFI